MAKSRLFKHFLRVLLLGIAVLALFSLKAKSQAFLSGKLRLLDSTDTLILQKSTNSVFGLHESLVITPYENGFDIILDLTEPTYFTLSFENRTIPLFLSPNDSLILDFATRKDGPEFIGAGSDNNRFLYEWYSASPYKSEEGFKDAVNYASIDQVEIELYDERMKKIGIVKKWRENDLVSKYLLSECHLSTGYSYLNSILKFSIYKTGLIDVVTIPKVMLSSINEQVLNNKLAVQNSVFLDFLKNYVQYKVWEENDFMVISDKNDNFLRKVEYASKILDPEVEQVFLASLIYNECSLIDKSGYEKSMNRLIKLDPDMIYSKEVQLHCLKVFAENDLVDEEQKKNIEKNTPKGPDYQFELQDLKGKKIDLNDFEGKIVYIDFWASWCGPCRQQMPFSKALKSKFSSKDKKEIVFLYISIDSDENAWKNAIDKLGIEGTHLIAPGAWNADIVRYFGISGIPRYIILDRRGNVLEDNAKRPSASGIYEDLINYINK